MLFKQQISTLPFKQWLLQDVENKRILWSTIILMAISFSLLKWMYPYPNFMPPDSKVYLEAASNNDLINLWPIGYSKFLRLVSVFSRSHIILIALQYLLLMASVGYFLFTIRYLLSPGKWLFRILVIVSILNPLLPHIANFVSSDCLFATLSLAWITQLFWIISRPSRILLLVHAIILLLAFMVRFTAIYYPLISIVIIWVTQPQKASTGILTISLPILIFYGRTQYEYKIKTNTVQFAAFGGWQMAANALYGYAKTQQDSVTTVPLKFKELHALVNRHLDSLNQLAIRPDKKIGVYYLWNFKSPLLEFMEQKIKGHKKSYFEKWAMMAPLYAKYGRYLAVQHPKSFIKHFVWPNLRRYYIPPKGFMGAYNVGRTTVDPIVVTWFGWTSNKVSIRTKNSQIQIISIIPTLISIINPTFLLCSLVFFGFKELRNCSRVSKGIVATTLLVCFCNMAFSVLAAPIELRYQIFPMIITFAFGALFLSKVIQSLQLVSLNNTKQALPLPRKIKSR